ncbi:hypothetical protein WA538_003995 [Blastocystis sp. DL]
MDAIHESSKRLSMLCRMTDEKLIQLHHDAQRVYTVLQDQETTPEDLSTVLVNGDKTPQKLLQERDELITEIEQLKSALHVLSNDSASFDAIIQERDDLQSQIHTLHEEIVQRNALISKLQIENSRIKSENGNLLQELADAIQVDEGLYPLEQ